MTPQSAKAKGRRLQQMCCELLFTVFGTAFGLEPDDFLSRSMGANGEDIMISPAARRVIGDVKAECKFVEALNVHGVFEKHAKTYPGKPVWLIHKKSRSEILVTLRFSEFLETLRKASPNGPGNA